MSKQDESFRKSEKLIKVSKRESTENKPGSCAYGQKDNVFRKKPLKRDKFS